jgi:TonB family protein
MRRLLCAAAAATIAFAGAAAAAHAGAPAGPALETAPEAPDWLAAPSFEDLARAYPPEALAKGVSGQTALRCTVEPDGALADCVLAAETPAGQGFGAASLSLAGRFRMKPQAVAALAGTPPQVRVPIRWAIVASPDWIRQPTGDDLAGLYPDEALNTHRSGDTKIRCRVKADGTLADCFVLYESPEGLGFGQATLRAAAFFRMSPETVDGKRVEGGTVEIPMRWQIGGGESSFAAVGDDAMLITVLKDGARPASEHAALFRCPTAADPRRRCEGRLVAWSERPTPAELRAVMAEHHIGGGVTRLSCRAGDDRRLTDCALGGQATPDQEAAMRALAARLRTAGDDTYGVLLKLGRIVVQFDWDDLRRASKPGR